MESASAGLISRARTAAPGLALTLALAAAAGVALSSLGCRRRSPGHLTADAGSPASAAIAGRVLDRKDHPVPEARVLLFPLAGGADPLESATDLDGRFHLERVPFGLHRVLVEAAGFPTAEQQPVSAPAAGLLIRLDGEGRAIVGQVLAAGVPVAGARVLLAADTGGPVRETATRGGGGFAFGGLGEGRYALRAAHGGDASAPSRAVEASEPGASAIARVRLELVPGTRFRGRVVDDAGNGLPEVDVRAEANVGVPGGDPLPALGRSDSNGGFALGPVPPGSYRLTAARPGAILRRAPVIEAAPPDAAARAVILELVRGAHVAGQVRDGHGAPAVGARVRCVASGIEDLTVQEGPLPLAAEAAAMPAGSGRALGASRATVADRQGRFVVDDLIPGRYRFEVAYPGAEPFRSDEFSVAPGERHDAGLLALRAGLSVEGSVIDDSAVPVEGARVAATANEPTASFAGAATVTDSEGRFALVLPAGGYRLSATASGHGGGQTSVELGATATPPAPIQIKLVRAEAKLEGLVRDDGGRPLGRARITVFPADAPAAGPATPAGSGTADVGGHFAIAGLPAGDLRLEIEHPDYPRSSEIVPAGRYALVTVPFPGAVSGQLRVRVSGAEVSRARVEAVGPGGAKAIAEVRKGGSFQLSRLVPGHWRLTIAAPGFRTAAQELDVPASVTLGEPSVRDLRVELDPT